MQELCFKLSFWIRYTHTILLLVYCDIFHESVDVKVIGFYPITFMWWLSQKLLTFITCVSVATLKLDISPPYAHLPCCLTSNLWQVEPYTDMNRRPTREIEEFPSRPVYSPNIIYKWAAIGMYLLCYYLFPLQEHVVHLSSVSGLP